MRILNWAESPERTLTASVDCLKQGGLVAFPTDTLYGLGADVTNDKAVRRLFQAKRRPSKAAVPILVADEAQACRLVESMPPLTLKLASLYWPGPLTMVLQRSPSFGSVALAGSDSIALRVPDHAVPLGLIRALSHPITGTSANRSGQPSPRTASEVVKQLDSDIDIVIEGGPSPLGTESTVVDLRGDIPHILREGAIRRDDLEAATGVRFEMAER